jgi:hypothetical protein
MIQFAREEPGRGEIATQRHYDGGGSERKQGQVDASPVDGRMCVRLTSPDHCSLIRLDAHPIQAG